MKTKSLLWSGLCFFLVLSLSACVPILGRLSPDSGGEEIELEGEEVDLENDEMELEGEEVDLQEPEAELPGAKELAKEGDAQINYHYSIKRDDLSFEINALIGISITPEADGVTYTVSGIGQDRVEFMMLAAGGPENQCRTWCTVDLNYVADGTVETDQDQHSCKMPIRFTFVANQENWERTSECSPESWPLLDCARLSMVMLDPSIYTFTKTDRNPTIPSDWATLYATMSNLSMPSGLQGLCDW
jgi:hypothetical protein